MSKVRNVISLYTTGVSKQSIGERTGLPRNSVKKYIRLFLASGMSLEEIGQMNDTQLEQFFMDMVPRYHIEDDPRYLSLVEFFPTVEKALKKWENTKEKLWQQYIALHPDGYRISQFKGYYLKWLKVRNPVMHMEHKAGEKMYVDYAGQKLHLVDPESGSDVPVEVFVAILGASQLTYVEASYSQKKENFIGSCENVLHYFGGVPNAIVTDNLKSAVIKGNRFEPSLNEAFRDFVSHYMMAALPAAPYKPRYKALVEGAVKIIYRTIYGTVKERVYSSLELLNQAIGIALEEHNTRPLKNRPFSRRQLFEETERHTLNPLPEHRYERIAVHHRNHHPFGYTTVNEHLASKHRYMSDWNPDKFIERGEEIGPETKEYIIQLLSSRQHPEQTYRSCQGVLSFAARAGKERLNNACKRALQYGDYGYQTIRAILEKGLDRNTDEQLLITGSTGIGKSYIASAIGNQACTLGHKVLYANTAKLFSRLKMAKADGSYIREIAKIERQDLLILDDFGLQPLDGSGRSVLMEIIEDRHGNRSTIVTSQLPVSQWYEVIGEQTVADAILDRIVHDAHRIELLGESLRRTLKNKITENVEIV